jgi:transcriptional regulator GlxA family with amidase domain
MIALRYRRRAVTYGAVRVREIVILIFPGVNILDVAGPAQVFTSAAELQAASQPGSEASYQVRLVSLAGGLIETTSGIELQSRSIESIARGSVDTLLIAGGHGSETAGGDPRVAAWLRAMQPKVRRLGSICTGAFVLALAGLADGRRLATHWAYCERLQAEHPGVAVERDAIFIEDGGIWSSAGITSGLDLALAMVEEDWGRELALLVSRRLVVFLKRSGGQSQFSMPLQAQTAEGPFANLVKWVAENPAADHRVERLAARANVSARTLHRAFRSAFRCTPAEWVVTMRLEAARRRLEGSNELLERVAEKSGFPSGDAMRRSFLRQLGVTPSAYRERFHHPGRPSSPALQLALHDAAERASVP